MLRDAFYLVIILVCIGGFYAALNAWSPSPLGHASVTPAPAFDPNQPLSGIGAKFNKHLLMFGPDGQMHDVSEARMKGIRYWAFYYSGSWCPPSQAFTPRLVAFYNSFKPSHPDFEVIFVSDDKSHADMLDYMKDDSMPWPGVYYDEIGDPDLDANKFSGDAIPCLVLVDNDGNVLSDTYVNGQYTDPQHVIDDISTMVK